MHEAERRRNEFVCVEHVLWAMLDDTQSRDILSACGADLDMLRGELEKFFDTLDTVPAVVDYQIEQTIALTRILRRAAIHVQSSGKTEIGPGDILAAMYREPESQAVYLLKGQEISRLDVLDYISHGVSKEDEDSPFASMGDGDGDGGPEDGHSKGKKSQDPLKAYTTLLNQRARDGKLDPLVGRDEELKRTIHVLCRRRKNNPIFVGEPGVGKTAIAEGLAQKIEDGDVPEVLEDAQIYSLDMGALIGGTKFRGEFEQRLKAVIEAITSDSKRILFIDEIHTIVGAGAVSGGTLDASNILKPALGSGELRCMGSTTYKEFQGVFAKDRALARRFQKIDINEPSVAETVKILKGLKDRYEEHHGITYTTSAL